MTIYLSTYSSLEALAAAARTSHGRIQLSTATNPHWEAPLSEDVRHIAHRCPFLRTPLHVVVPHINLRRNLRHATFLVSRSANIPGALWTISPNNRLAEGDSALGKRRGPTLGTSAPAFCLAQLAREVPLPLLTELACAFTGLYKFAPASTGFVLDAQPITSTAAMANWLAENPSVPGARQAYRAVSCAIGNLGSPAETLLYLLLCLPKKMGGHGFPTPIANGTLIPTVAQQRSVSQRDFYPDLIWPERRLIVEYDSKRYHGSPDKQAHDAKRRNELEALGYRVVTVTKPILYREDLFDKTVDQIRRHLGIRAFRTTGSWLKQRRELRSTLLNDTRANRWWR